MAKFVLRQCVVFIGTFDLSGSVNSVEVSMSKDSVDVSNFGTGNREVTAGLKSDKFTVNFTQDFAAANVDAVLYPIYANETPVTVKVKPTTAATSATNPYYLATTCIMLDYTPLSGKIGDLSEASVDFVANGTGIDRLVT